MVEEEEEEEEEEAEEDDDGSLDLSDVEVVERSKGKSKGNGGRRGSVQDLRSDDEEEEEEPKVCLVLPITSVFLEYADSTFIPNVGRDHICSTIC